jgi:SpoVK/Ycf46/Vps4 family AAA+-type ATPase
VARILTRIFYDFGYIRKNRIVEVDGEYLKSPYVGQTGERTSAIVQWAMGGVLFVDEAYLLFNEKDNNSVGSEATGVLLKAMEDHRDDLIVIFAGYEDAMNRLIASNEGFASRVKHKLYFDVYSPEELTQIFELFLKKAGQHVDRIDPDARELLKSELEAESKLPGFGNARSARNACDALLDIHADRFIEGTEDAANRGIITYGDVEMFVEQQKKKFAADGRNFMATNHIDEGIISSAELRSRTRKGADDWKKAMASLVGMDRVKQELIAFKERADFFKSSGIEDDGVTLNLQFVGPPGVGKTTAAAIVASILYDAGYIRENRYLDVNGDFFKASYVGQTGKRTQAILEYSKGMVLFIDEAYLLSASAGSGHDFGAEAIGVIVDAMEKNRGELVIVFAGYEREMEDFMSVNSGLASRVAATIHFEPYDMREMMTIFARMCAQRKFKVDGGAWPNVKMAIEAAEARPNFGNARFVRQLSQDAISRHATRFAHGKVSDANKFVIESNDIVVEL